MIAAVHIRAARSADAAEIAALSVELGYPATAQEISSRLSALLALADRFVAVAVGPDSALVGWVAAERRLLLESGERAELVGLVVASAARRTGIGAALVAAAERWAARQGLGSMVVRSNVVRAESHPFYESLGYTRKKTQHTYEKRL
jgi:GNAT superfamily N-acetyltransferase